MLRQFAKSVQHDHESEVFKSRALKLPWSGRRRRVLSAYKSKRESSLSGGFIEELKTTRAHHMTKEANLHTDASQIDHTSPNISGT